MHLEMQFHAAGMILRSAAGDIILFYAFNYFAINQTADQNDRRKNKSFNVSTRIQRARYQRCSPTPITLARAFNLQGLPYQGYYALYMIIKRLARNIHILGARESHFMVRVCNPLHVGVRPPLGRWTYYYHLSQCARLLVSISSWLHLLAK